MTSLLEAADNLHLDLQNIFGLFIRTCFPIVRSLTTTIRLLTNHISSIEPYLLMQASMFLNTLSGGMNVIKLPIIG